MKKKLKTQRNAASTLVRSAGVKPIKGVDLAKLTARHPNSILQGFPQPVDARFDNMTGDMEFSSRLRNTKAGTIDFNSPVPRGELWGKP